MNVADQGEDCFVLDGGISHFQWAEGHENLLEEIQSRARVKSAVSGAAAALNMYGTLATSAMVAMYEGEYTENFACVVNGKVVCGTFCGARKLQNGDQVKMVVSPLENGVLYAHAVQRSKDELLWMPSQVFCGDRAALNAEINLMKYISIAGWIVFSLICVIGAWLEGWSWSDGVLMCIGSAFVIPAVAFGGTFLPGRAGKAFGEIGSKIFTLLEFPDPDDLDMLRADYERQTGERETRHIYMYRLALDAHANGTEITTKLGREIDAMVAENKQKKMAEKQRKKQEKQAKKTSAR